MGRSKAFAGQYILYCPATRQYRLYIYVAWQYVAQENGFQLSFDPTFDPIFHGFQLSFDPTFDPIFHLYINYCNRNFIYIEGLVTFTCGIEFLY